MSRVIHPYGATHYVLPRAELGGGAHAMVKEADFFYEQEGHTKYWGNDWIPVVADGIHHARLLAYFIAQQKAFPSGIAFSPPNHKTVGQLKKEGFNWPIQK